MSYGWRTVRDHRCWRNTRHRYRDGRLEIERTSSCRSLRRANYHCAGFQRSLAGLGRGFGPSGNLSGPPPPPGLRFRDGFTFGHVRFPLAGLRARSLGRRQTQPNLRSDESPLFECRVCSGDRHQSRAWETPYPVVTPAIRAGSLPAVGRSPAAALYRGSLLLATLPPHHRDPFDRTLICQALFHQMAFASSDPLVRQYAVPLI